MEDWLDYYGGSGNDSNGDPKGKNTPLVLSVISSLIANHILLSPPQFGVWWKREAWRRKMDRVDLVEFG